MSKPLSKIFIAANSFPPKVGGLENFSFEIAKHLHLLGKNITVLAPWSPQAAEFDKKQNFKIIRTNSKVSLFLKFISLPKTLKVDKILLLHRADYATWAWWGNSLLGISWDVVTHGAELFYPGKEKKIRRNFQKAKNIFSVSSFSRQRLLTLGIPEEKIKVIPPGVDIEKFKPGLDASEIKKKYNLKSQRIILSVGRLVERKGIPTLIKTLRILKENIPNFVCFIIGEGKEKGKLEEMAKNNDLAEKIIFTGYVPEKELPLYYNLSDVFVLPSYGSLEEVNPVRSETSNGVKIEGFGIVALEASACGKPVVASRTGGITDVVIDKETGFLFEPSNESQLAKKIEELLKNQEVAQKFGARGRKRVENQFPWPEIARKYITIWEKSS